eukprot:4525621-Karenia_brevis.AAC.1
MAKLKLITLGNRSFLRISSSNGATRCHCSPYSEMAAYKLITSGDKHALLMYLSSATCCHC